MIATLYTTFPDENTALELTQRMVDEKLIVCANLFPIKSVYPWEGKTEVTDEIAVYLKTIQDKVGLVSKFLKAHHPYDVPIIALHDRDVNLDYLKWAQQSLK